MRNHAVKVPVSARIIELLKPHVQAVMEADVFENLASMACVGWNMAITEKRVTKNVFPHVNGTPELMVLVKEFAIRKEQLFPDDSRLILNCDVKYIPPGSKPDLYISSIAFEDCFLPGGIVRDGVPSGNILRWQEISLRR